MKETTPIQDVIKRLTELAESNTHSSVISTTFRRLAEEFERELLPKEEKLFIETYVQADLDTCKSIEMIPDNEDLLEMHIEAVYHFNNKFGTSSVSTNQENAPSVLSKDAFWDELSKKYPSSAKAFYKWINHYKAKNKWKNLFPETARLDYPTDVKFHHLPIAMQFGIINEYSSYGIEINNDELMKLNIEKFFQEAEEKQK